ncbi:hypothetical protein K6W76_25585 [Burkholderia anthina]|nr:hypothetical protein [Burkholderia anthina]
MKTFVGRAAGPSKPRARRGLLIEFRRVRLDPKKRGDILVGLDAEPPSCDVCIPEARRQSVVVGQLRVGFDEIEPRAFDISACIDLGKAGDLFACQFKHAGALPLISRSPPRAN